MISFAAALFVYRVPFLKLFSNDAAVIKIGDEMLFYQSLTFVALAFYFVFFRALQGAGDVMFAMIVSVANSVINMALGTYLAVTLDWGPTGIFVSGLTTIALSTTLLAGWIASGRWTRMQAFSPQTRP